MFRRWFLAVALLLVAAGLLTVFGLAGHHRRALERYRTELRDQGHLKTFAELAPPPLTNGPDGAPALTNILERLPEVPDYPWPAANLPPGTRRAVWREIVPPQEGQTNTWSALLDFVRTNAADLAELRAACASPAFDFPLDYSAGSQMTMDHLPGLLRVPQLLRADALVQLHQRRPNEALASICEGVNFIARWNREPLLITQLVRLTRAGLLNAATWDLLDYGGWTDADLARLQAAWAEVDLAANADAVFAYEAAYMEHALGDPRRLNTGLRQAANLAGSGGDSLADLIRQLIEDPKAGLEEVVERYPRWWAFRLWRRHQLALTLLRQNEAARAAYRETARTGAWLKPALSASNLIAQLDAELPPLPLWLAGSGSTYGGILFRYASIESRRAIVVTAIALERHRLRHGEYPAQLADLAPHFLPAVPRDPMDGQALRYRRADDGQYLLYGVGENGVDDGGDPTPAGNSRAWELGRDAVWPRRAADEAR